MALIKFEKFRGQAPIASPTRLPPNMAQTAQNCRFEGGVLKPLRDTSYVQSSPQGASTQTIFYYPPNDVWLTWDHVVDVQRSMIAQDSYRRLYWTDPTDKPQYATKTMIGSAGGTYPITSQRLGVPAPTLTPTVLVLGSPSDPTDLPDSRYYVFTYVESSGAEGPPSPISAMVDVYPGQSVAVGNMGTATPDASYDITRKRIYRTNSGETGSIFQLVDGVDIDDETYSDTKESAALEDELTTQDYDEPEELMEGLVAHPGGFFVAYHESTLYFSEPGYPYAWPVKYQLGVDYDIMGLAVINSSVIVTTTGTPYVLEGGTPSSMSLRRVEENQACLSTRGVVDLGYAACYPSPDGLVLITSNGVKVITETLFSRDQWLALKPSSFVAVQWEGKYLCSYDTGTEEGSFALDPASPDAGVVFYDTVFTAAYNYLADDYLYLLVGSNIVTWDSSATALSYTWRSGKLQSPRPMNAGVMQVRADTYPVTAAVYADGTRRYRTIVYDAKPVRLPAGYLGELWEAEITGTGEVYEVIFAETVSDLRGG
jgi:hypothetical protein